MWIRIGVKKEKEGNSDTVLVCVCLSVVVCSVKI